MLYGWKYYQVYFHIKQRRLCLTSKREVMDILVEVVQAVMELRGIKNNTAPINPQMQPFTC
jgi:hypothetical protein